MATPTIDQRGPLVAVTDKATQSNYHQIRTTHLDFAINVDWKRQTLSGSITHHLTVLESAHTLILDTAYLEITAARTSAGTPLAFKLAPRNGDMGSALTINLERQHVKGEKVEIVVEFATTDKCTALGWLGAEQTGSGLYPFVYSQNQAIHARSMFPLMDTPGVKLTWKGSATSTLPILMSGLRLSPSGNEALPIDGQERTYVYEQTQLVPSYLLAIAGGELVFASLGERTGVWAEPSLIKAAEWEFKQDAERFLETAESVASKYGWGRYDVLVLPASFPFGGMENTNLTFLTPALITGDRSEVDVICHEISHSWFGNSIGCASWSSFWLNEGWTTYCERLAIQAIHGSTTRSFEYIVGQKALDDSLKSMPPRYQRLHIPYKEGEDPDDAFSSIPYEKGAQLLLHLERTVGGLEIFSPYIKAYLARFSGLAISTDDWLNHLNEYWSAFPEQKKALDKVDWDSWLNGEGLTLPVKLKFDTSLADASYALAKRWNEARTSSPSDFSPKDIAEFSSKQVSLFLETLQGQEAYGATEIQKMGEAYAGSFNGGNSEIRVRWFAVALKAGFLAAEAAKWVQKQGRMKYCRPTYLAISKVDKPLAISTFLEARSFYHPIAARLIAKDLGIE